MLKELIKKDILIALKDLKFQLFTVLIISLFLLSTGSAINRYKTDMKQYQSKMMLYQKNIYKEANSLMKLLEGDFSYFKAPSKDDIIIREDNFPKSISTSIANFRPYNSFGDNKQSGFQFDWIFIVGILGSFTALLFSYNAISEEKKRGTFRLKTIGGASRDQIVLSKFSAILIIFVCDLFFAIFLSIFLYIGMTGGIDSDFILNSFIFYLISILYLSFFIWSGILVSMSKNVNTNIVIALSFWLLFVIIIPMGSTIIAKRIKPLKSNKYYNSIMWNEYGKEFKKWSDKYDNHSTGENHIGGNGFLKDGLRAKAFYASREAMVVCYRKTLEEHERQIKLKETISTLSPYFLFIKIIESITDKGLSRYQNEIKFVKEKRDEIEKEFKKQDAENDKSLHFFYRGAFNDKNVIADEDLVPFSDKVLENKEMLILNYKSKSFAEKIPLILIPSLFLFLLNFITIILVKFKIGRYDIR